MVEDAVGSLSQSTGLFGYVFTEVTPEFQKDADTLTMGINFNSAEAKRTYVERIEIDGSSNSQTALGGTTYYLARLELGLPMGSGARELGLEPSIYLYVGAVFGGKSPTLTDTCAAAISTSTACVAGPRQYTNSSGELLHFDSAGASTTANTGTAYTYSLGSYRETYSGNSASPRLSIGIGVDWTSPFGPLRLDLAKALLKQPGGDRKLITFHIGGQF
jgi:outer membrane protein insertion porin family